MANTIHQCILRPKAARLIPTLADSKKEERATSIILAALMHINPFAQRVLASIGQRVGNRAKIECFTEVDLENKPEPIKHRPDGLIIVTIGKRCWSALIEAKIEANQIEQAQIESYVRLAKSNGVNALISISNQFATRPEHLPYSVSGHATRNFEIYHWSWNYLVAEAMLVTGDKNLEIDREQAVILREVTHYFLDKSSGVRRKTQMNPEWKKLVSTISAGGQLNRKSSDVETTVRHWHEEEKDLTLILSEHLSAMVTVKLSRAHLNDPTVRLQHDIDHLVDNLELVSEIDIPNAAAPLVVTAKLSRRSISCSMSVQAPDDRQRYASRLNWLLKQLPSDLPSNVNVTIRWPGRTPPTVATVQSLRSDPAAAQPNNAKLLPSGFEVSMWLAHGGTFSGPKTFIESLEKLATDFYDNIGQHLRKWQASPPKPTKDSTPSLPEDIFAPAKFEALQVDRSLQSPIESEEQDPTAES